MQNYCHDKVEVEVMIEGEIKREFVLGSGSGSRIVGGGQSQSSGSNKEKEVESNSDIEKARGVGVEENSRSGVDNLKSVFLTEIKIESVDSIIIQNTENGKKIIEQSVTAVLDIGNVLNVEMKNQKNGKIEKNEKIQKVETYEVTQKNGNFLEKNQKNDSKISYDSEKNYNNDKNIHETDFHGNIKEDKVEDIFAHIDLISMIN